MNDPYPAYERPCGWNALLPPAAAPRVLRGKIDCEVAIIGAGFTGLAAARRFAALDSKRSVALLESSRVGEGNPGRNSGFLLEISLANDADPHAVERMRECNRLIGRTMQDLVALVRSCRIDCRLERRGTYRAAAGDAGRRALERYCRFLSAADLPFESLDREKLRQRIGTDFYGTGLYSPHCYLAQPAALVRGLAVNLPPGVELYEQSPALSLERSGRHWHIRSRTGSVRAAIVVVANNAFAARLGIGRSRVAAIFTYAGLTDPLPPAVLDRLGSDPNWGLLPAHRLGSTFRRTPDGRLLVRSQYDYECERPNRAAGERLADSLCRRFPALGGVALPMVWGGATGFTLNGAPLWGEYARGLYVSAGCNGGGVVKGTLFGGLIADLATGEDVPDVDALFGAARWMPPEPLRRIGFAVASALERRRGGAEI